MVKPMLARTTLFIAVAASGLSSRGASAEPPGEQSHRDGRRDRPPGRRTRRAAPRLSVRTHHVAVLDHAGRDPALATEIVRLLNDPPAMERELEPAPVERFNTTAAGSRGLTARSDKLPGRWLRLTGIGVVKGGYAGGKPLFVVEPPQPETRLAELRHLRDMGSSYIARDGSAWEVKNSAPFGAYWREEMERKVANTEAFAPPDEIELVAAGHFEGTEMGWFVYSMPDDVITPQEIYRGAPELYPAAMRALGRRLRESHDRGHVHLQPHAANWFLRYERGEPVALLSDWSTAADLSALPTAEQIRKLPGAKRSERFERYMAELDPVQRARALDLERALESSVVPQGESRVSGRGPGISDEHISMQLRHTIAALDGYNGWELDAEQRAEMLDKLTGAYQTLAMDQLVVGGGEPVASYEELKDAPYGEMAQASTMYELFRRVARASAGRPGGDALRKDLLGDAELIAAATEWFDKNEE